MSRLARIAAFFQKSVLCPPFTRRRQGRPPTAAAFRRPLRFELLETRDLLSVSLHTTSISATTARDGQTLTLNYEISSTEAQPLVLQATLIGPAGEIIADHFRDATAPVTTAPQWYSRPIFVNLPPNAQRGTYSVVWTVHGDPAGDVSLRQDAVLTIAPPVEIRVPILMYHNIGPVPQDVDWVTPAALRAHVLALQAYGYTPITFTELMNYRAGIGTPPAKPVMLTFDDGYLDFYTQAYPVLAELNAKSTVFVITQDADNNPNAMNWSQLQSLDPNLVDIQGHTVTHPLLSSLSDTALRAELVNSKQSLESHLGKEIRLIAYPSGDTSPRVEQAAWDAGYQGGVIVWGGTEQDSADKWELSRIGALTTTSVNFDPNLPDEFLFFKIEDATVVVPQLAITAIDYLDASGARLAANQILPGQTVGVRVTAMNIGEASAGVVRLQLDSDNDRSNGIAYDSHLAGQDVAWNFPYWMQTFDFTWTVPLDATPGQFYANVAFLDPHAVLSFYDSLWQPAILVTPAQPLPVLVDRSLSTPTARDGQTLTLNYQISSAVAQQIVLQATLIGPTGETIADHSRDTIVQLAPGTQWYSRPVFVNLPPQAQTGAYRVVWTVHGPAGDVTAGDENALTIQPPLEIHVPIIMYHNIGPVPQDVDWVTPTMLRAHVEALLAYGYTPITFSELMNYRAGIGTPPAKPVMLTFDDAYLDFYTQAYPVLSALNVKSTVFVIIQDAEGNPNAMNWPELLALDPTLVDLESHTVTHPFLTTLSDAELQAELAYSKQSLEEHLGKEIRLIAYTSGDTDLRVEQAAWQAGYAGGLLAWGGVEETTADKWELTRVGTLTTTSVNYDPSLPDEFLFTKIEDPTVIVPAITINSTVYLDPSGTPLPANQLLPGQTVVVRVAAVNTGPAASGRVRLQLDSDNDPSNGIAYDSHLAGQDLVWNFAAGPQTFDFTWTVPLDATPGPFYADVAFNDQFSVLGFKDSLWQPGFVVLPVPTDPVLLGTAGADAFFVTLDATGTVVQVWQNAATPGQGPPAYAFALAQLHSLTLAGQGGDDRCTLDFARGNPVPSGGLRFDGQAGGDRLCLIGTSADADATLTPVAFTINGSTASFTSVESFRFGTESGDGGLVKDGPGVLKLVGPQTYVGETVVNGGTLQPTSGGALPRGTSLTINSGCTVIISPATTGTVVLNSPLIDPGGAPAAPPAAATDPVALTLRREESVTTYPVVLTLRREGSVTTERDDYPTLADQDVVLKNDLPLPLLLNSAPLASPAPGAPSGAALERLQRHAGHLEELRTARELPPIEPRRSAFSITPVLADQDVMLKHNLLLKHRLLPAASLAAAQPARPLSRPSATTSPPRAKAHDYVLGRFAAADFLGPLGDLDALETLARRCVRAGKAVADIAREKHR